MLVQDQLLTLPQRLQALFILTEVWTLDASQNAFLLALLTLIEAPEREECERWFISMLLTSGTKEVHMFSRVLVVTCLVFCCYCSPVFFCYYCCYLLSFSLFRRFPKELLSK
jgi:hypothetical protein